MEYSSKSEIRLILLGKTGSGKSRTGNSILDRNVFQFQSLSRSCTSSCDIESSRRFKTKLVVIDTPGLFDSCMTNAQVQEQIWKSILFSSPGPHVFLFCVEMGRFTKQDDEVVQHYIHHFGEGILKHMIFVFTKLDIWHQGMIDSGEENIDLTQFIKQLPQYAKDVLKQCGNRYVAFNNRQSGRLNGDQVLNLLRIAEEDIMKKRGSYTNKTFQKAEQIFRDLVSEKKIDLAEENTEKAEKKDDTFTKEKVKKAIFKSFLQVVGGALFQGVKFGIDELLK